MSVDGRLRSADLELFKSIGVEPAVLAVARVRRVDGAEARDLCGIRYQSDQLEGLAFPYLDPDDGRVVTWRVRRDHPELESDGKPVAKYLSPPDRKHLYFEPGASQMTDTAAPVIVVESEKSVLALSAARQRMNRTPWPLVIATGGCWGWRGVIGKTIDANGARVDQRGPLPDFDRVAWTDRDVVILFDANSITNEQVQAARRVLAKELSARGAKVRIAELPIEDGINGPDDYAGKHGAAALFALIDAAKPAGGTKKKNDTHQKPKQGRSLQLEDPEPWADPVNGACLLDAIAAMFLHHLALPPHASVALALWTLHTYAFGAWFVSPFLGITSPVKRCGKTLLLIVLGALVPRRLFASNVTPAVLFRTIEMYGPVLLIDEADTFMRDNDELRGVLNSGHTRTTAIAIRAVGEDHDPRVFSTWCAKAIALIGKLPATLADRAIEIRMRRRTAGERVARLRQDRIESECTDLRRQAARWAADHLHDLREADPQVPAALHDRAADCWRPLLAIADRSGGAWPERAREAALALSGECGDENDVGIILLRDIKGIFEAEGDPEVLASNVIIERLAGIEDRPWAEWSSGRPLSPAKLARLLAAYEIFPAGNIRMGAKVLKGYRRTAFADAWDRYGAQDGDLKALQRNKGNNDGHDPAKTDRYTDPDCSGFQSVTNPMITGQCSGVAVPKGGAGVLLHPDYLWRDAEEQEDNADAADYYGA
ncbi:MAG: DUF3631 domain-containing protein [Acidobacteria bacterium]|nr:DUF3631 domain-containing protein [Acidobacteriota bacterium]